MNGIKRFCWALRLRSKISSFLDVRGLCAERATSPQSSSRKAHEAVLCWILFLLNYLAVAQAFVAQLVQLVRPETQLTQMGDSESAVLLSKKQVFARPAVLLAVADIYGKFENRHKIPQLEQALARDCFQVFAGVQGVCNSCMLDTKTWVSCRCSISSSKCLNYTRIQLLDCYWPFSRWNQHAVLQCNIWGTLTQTYLLIDLYSSCQGHTVSRLAPIVLCFSSVVIFLLVTVVLFGLIVEPWGSKGILQAGATALKLWWASNPGAMMQVFSCWKKHGSVSLPGQLIVLSTARAVFNHLDSSACLVKQMFATEVMRLETESRDQSVQLIVSRLLHEFPEIRQLRLWLQCCKRGWCAVCFKLLWSRISCLLDGTNDQTWWTNHLEWTRGSPA